MEANNPSKYYIEGFNAFKAEKTCGDFNKYEICSAAWYLFNRGYQDATKRYQNSLSLEGLVLIQLQ